MKKIHLLCNAHLDPVWLWRWDEGAAEALSTFRIAADFCDQYDSFIFNHNEALLYQWIEEYDIELFERIKELVKKGKWHIMGGWYLQPDCNMPSGEAMVRQILEGRMYFKEKFNIVPKTAINFDSFGHSRGLVQIMKKSGFDSYVFGRPFQSACELEKEDFIWVGYDGSEILLNRPFDHYTTLKGTATKKIEKWIDQSEKDALGLILWGIGNHGGGPSKVDLDMIANLIKNSDHEILHSTTDHYFNDLVAKKTDFPRYYQSLNAFAVGCYTSQVRIKQKYRKLENEYFVVEKMATLAYMNKLIDYPKNELSSALKDMLFCQFHDILPGSSIKAAENDALRKMEHGLEILSKLKTKIFLIQAKSFESGDEFNQPIFVYNPQPYKIKKIVECEFQLANQNWDPTHTIPIVYKEDKQVPSQLEKEVSSLNLDWRKKIAFEADLEPLSVNRFYCKYKIVDNIKKSSMDHTKTNYTFSNNTFSASFNTKTGLLNSVIVDGCKYIDNEVKFLVIKDNEDAWGMQVSSFDEIIGEFELMSDVECREYCGIDGDSKSLRIIEDGDIRTVVEAIYKYNNSYIIAHYSLPKKGCEIKISFTTYINEANTMIKLSIPDNLTNSEYFGQVMFGTEKLKSDGSEVVSQKWCGAFSVKDNKAITVANNGSYGSDYNNNAINLSILRTAVHTGHPILDRPLIAKNRIASRIDQGEREFSFWLHFGKLKERQENIDREALNHNQELYSLSYYPTGGNKKPLISFELSNSNVELSSLKKAENSDDIIIRLYNPLETNTSTSIIFTNLSKKETTINLTPYEIKTLRYSISLDEYVECNLMED